MITLSVVQIIVIFPWILSIGSQGHDIEVLFGMSLFLWIWVLPPAPSDWVEMVDHLPDESLLERWSGLKFFLLHFSFLIFLIPLSNVF